MSKEEKLVYFHWKDGTQTYAIVELYEEAPDEQDMVLLSTKIGEKHLNFKSENFFEALKQLRHHLEEHQIQIVCNGAALNVYPSPMAFHGTWTLSLQINVWKTGKNNRFARHF